jgi:hypothetical protein
MCFTESFSEVHLLMDTAFGTMKVASTSLPEGEVCLALEEGKILCVMLS